MNYWLLKTEPDAFSIEDLENAVIEPWDGIRNAQARNNIRSMEIGDHCFIYHSSCKIPGIVGLAEVVSTPYPDPSQFKSGQIEGDKEPKWWCIDVKHIKTYENTLSLREIKAIPSLSSLVLLKQSRLSIQPVSNEEWTELLRYLN